MLFVSYLMGWMPLLNLLPREWTLLPPAECNKEAHSGC